MKAINYAAAAALAAIIGLSGCSAPQSAPQEQGGKASVSKRAFGQTADGTPVDLYTLSNANGFEASITNYGAILVSLKTPDRNGTFGDVILGFENLDGYLATTRSSGPSWAAMETASPKGSSRSTVRCTSWP